MNKYLLLSTATLMSVAAPAFAAMDASNADIVVTGTPLTSAADLGALAAPAQTARAADITASHAIDLTDYLRRMTGGVFINDIQNNPLQPDVNYRGFTASPLLGTPQGLSLYLDGVRLNQPFGDVVSWDLIPKAAISTMTLIPGSNPLFGRNTLGGALSIRTKDGKNDPGTVLEGTYGSFNRRTFEATTGGSSGGVETAGFNWFLTANHFAEDGWRDASPSKATQAFAKVGWSDARTDIALSGTYARTDLTGNGLQEQTLLAADRSSIYTKPDETHNRAGMVNATIHHNFTDSLSFAGNAFWRKINTRTYNGDINEDAFGENIYQPSVAERAALTRAGITGFPTSGETQANTPFPKYRCIANALLNSEPNEKCNGLINRTSTRQHEIGISGEFTLVTPIASGSNRLTAGGTWVHSKADFTQSSQFGYLTPDRGIVGVTGPGAFSDGTQDSENAFDARVELTGRTTGWGIYAADAIDLTPALLATVSARYDHTHVDNRDGLTPGGGTGSLDGNYNYGRFNPSVALDWNPSKAIGFRVSAGQGSRAPSAIELGCADPESPCRLPNALAGDPPLHQVVARTIDIGAHGAVGGHLNWNVGIFRTVNRNDILFVADDQAGFGYFRNFGKTRRQGVEVGVEGKWSGVRARLNYTYLDATYRSAETVDGSFNSSNDGPGPGFQGNIAIRSGDRIPLIPRHIFKAGADWDATSKISFNVDLIAQSGSNARGNENGQHEPDGVYYLGQGKTDAYAVVNLGGQVKLLKALTLFAQVDNVLDKGYENAAQLGTAGFDANGGFVSRPFAGPVIDGERPLRQSTFYSPGAPRSARVGVRLRF